MDGALPYSLNMSVLIAAELYQSTTDLSIHIYVDSSRNILEHICIMHINVRPKYKTMMKIIVSCGHTELVNALSTFKPLKHAVTCKSQAIKK